MSVTIKDIAEKLGIAASTVSKGLNGAGDISEQTKQLVLDTAVEMGYASKKIQQQGTRRVCVFVENMDYENINEFGYEIINGFKVTAALRGWEVCVIPSNLNLQTKEKYDSYMLKNNISGAFLLGFSLHDDWLSQLETTKVPTVLMDNYIKHNPNVGYVGTDNYEGIELSVGHLSALGHKNIAFLNGSKNSMVSEERYLSFIQSLKIYNLPVREELIVYGYYVPDCARYHVPSFIKNGATAIVCASDLIASGVMNEVMHCGLRVPEDISVVGFDDLPLAAQLSPPLTTIKQDRSNIGKSAFLLLDGLVHGICVSKMLLRAALIERSSTAPCRASKPETPA